MIRKAGILILVILLTNCTSKYFQDKVPQDLEGIQWVMTKYEDAHKGELIDVTLTEILDGKHQIVIEFLDNGRMISKFNDLYTFKGRYKLRENKFLEIEPRIKLESTGSMTDVNLPYEMSVSFMENITHAKYYLINERELIIKYYNHRINDFGVVYFSPLSIFSNKL